MAQRDTCTNASMLASAYTTNMYAHHKSAECVNIYGKHTRSPAHAHTRTHVPFSHICTIRKHSPMRLRRERTAELKLKDIASVASCAVIHPLTTPIPNARAIMLMYLRLRSSRPSAHGRMTAGRFTLPRHINAPAPALRPSAPTLHLNAATAATARNCVWRSACPVRRLSRFV